MCVTCMSEPLCLQVHRPHLCVEEGLPSSLNGIAIDNSYGSDGRLIEGDQVIGWLKTIIGLRINQLGHKLLLLDSDSVFFSNPLESLDPAAHVAVTNDCDDTYHPKHNRYLRGSMSASSRIYNSCLTSMVLLR